MLFVPEVRRSRLVWLRFAMLLIALVLPQATAYPLNASECDEGPLESQVESQEFLRTSRETRIAPPHRIHEAITFLLPPSNSQRSHSVVRSTEGHLLANGWLAPLRC